MRVQISDTVTAEPRMTEQPKSADTPRPGHFKMKLVKGGPWVGARINEKPCFCTIGGGDENTEHTWTEDCDRSPTPRLIGEIGERETDPGKIWIYGTQITSAEHKYLIDTARWAKKHAPSDPAARPGKAIDLNQIPPIDPWR